MLQINRKITVTIKMTTVFEVVDAFGNLCRRKKSRQNTAGTSAMDTSAASSAGSICPHLGRAVLKKSPKRHKEFLNFAADYAEKLAE